MTAYVAGRNVISIEDGGPVPVALVDGEAFYAGDPPRWIAVETHKGDEYDEHPDEYARQDEATF